ncbi:MAG: ATP-dependent 6-phosphofructokinase, partial [Acidimicrobiia bacterium]|nr:ATP-dependent 6-phosphofructokinase [Acidimicrobiia bacterium]
MSVIGVLTAGGDCPGLNAVIRGVVARAHENHGSEVVGIMNGWEGLMDGDVRLLERKDVRGILVRGGTILGTSRKDPYVHGDGYASVARTLESNAIDSLVVIGGDGTLRTALKLVEDGVRVIGVPKTIDNDIAATDFTFGFDTAVQVVTDAIDRLTTTAESHNRVILVEVMGRTKGWIATYSGIAGGAEAILIPEIPYDLAEEASIMLDVRKLAQFMFGHEGGFWYAHPLGEIEGLSDDQLFAVPGEGALCILWQVGHIAHRERVHMTRICQGLLGVGRDSAERAKRHRAARVETPFVLHHEDGSRTFLGEPEHAQVGLMALVPQAADAVSVPLIAA